MIRKHKRKILFVTGVLCIIIFCSSCASQVRLSEEAVSSNDISKTIKARCHKWENFEARLKLKVTRRAGVSNFILHVWKYGKKIKIDVISLWGQTLAVGVIGEERSFIWLVKNKKLYVSDNLKKLSKLLVGISINPDELMGCVTGCFSAPKKYFKFASVNSGGYMDISEVYFGKSPEIKVRYNPAFSLSELDKVPLKVYVAINKSTIVIKPQFIKPLVSVPVGVFNINPPEYVEKYYL